MTFDQLRAKRVALSEIEKKASTELGSSIQGDAVDHLADLALREANLPATRRVWRSSLAGRLAAMPDPRTPQGRRHRLVVVLVLTACATLVVGNDCVTAIWQWAAGADQEVLARIGARYDAGTNRHLVPMSPTVRRVPAGVDGDDLAEHTRAAAGRTDPAGPGELGQ
jgi:HAMP domain-containing protein